MPTCRHQKQFRADRPSDNNNFPYILLLIEYSMDLYVMIVWSYFVLLNKCME